jgi:hypothetical protein
MTDHDLLARALHGVAAEMPPARLPEDLYRRGRRRGRRKKLVAAAAAAVLTIAVPLAVRAGGSDASPQRPAAPSSAPAVPATVHQPHAVQATVQDSPRGAASILFSGKGAGLGGLFYQSNIAVVGRDGSYRMLLAEANTYAGTDARLSPDGSQVAMTWGSTFGEVFLRHNVHVADLATGKVRDYKLATGDLESQVSPVGWSPDGRYLAVSSKTTDMTPTDELATDLFLLDLSSGVFRRLATVTEKMNATLLVAFAPDGRQLAVQAMTKLSIIDTADGTTRRVVDVGERRRLAGPGAWSPDGRRLAMADLAGCVSACTRDALSTRTWRLGYLDPQTGADTSGSTVDAVDGMVVEMLGWQADGDVVVLTYRCTPFCYTEYEGDRDRPRLLALHPGGGRSELITLPAFVERIDVARDLVLADRVGGPAPRPSAWPVALYVYRVGAVLLLVFVGLPTLIWQLVRRTRRRPAMIAAGAGR